MKNKKVKKLINQVITNLKSSNEVKCDSEYYGDWSSYDVDVTNRFKKLIMDIIEYRPNVSININESRITMCIDNVKGLKNTSQLRKVSDEDCLELSIMKDKGFTMVHGYRYRTNYIDKNIYTDLFDVISEKLKKINADNFNKIWENIVKDSGILRTNNLDEIFAEKLDKE